MDSIAHPFRFSGGHVVVVDDESDAYAAQIIAAVVKTEKGEMPLNPDFGTRQPEFAALDRSGIAYTVAAYHPSINIDSISETIEANGEVKIKIEFSTEQAIG